MDSPGRQQGETVLLEQMEGREESERGGGVAVLLNFNEYQGEFLLGFFSFSWLPLHSFFSGRARLPHSSKSLSHK